MTTNTDWIEWAGGECPVPGDTRVEVWLKCEPTESEALQYIERPARYWENVWQRKSGGNRIIAYRIVKP